jgi:hypothetical protein
LKSDLDSVDQQVVKSVIVEQQRWLADSCDFTNRFFLPA